MQVTQGKGLNPREGLQEISRLTLCLLACYSPRAYMAYHRVLAILFTVCLPVCKCPALITDNLAGYWPFDETNGGVAHEASGQGLNGSLKNFPEAKVIGSPVKSAVPYSSAGWPCSNTLACRILPSPRLR